MAAWALGGQGARTRGPRGGRGIISTEGGGIECLRASDVYLKCGGEDLNNGKGGSRSVIAVSPAIYGVESSR
jgi:hypothetical protein